MNIGSALLVAIFLFFLLPFVIYYIIRHNYDKNVDKFWSWDCIDGIVLAICLLAGIIAFTAMYYGWVRASMPMSWNSYPEVEMSSSPYSRNSLLGNLPPSPKTTAPDFGVSNPPSFSPAAASPVGVSGSSPPAGF